MGADHRTPAVVMPPYRSVHCSAAAAISHVSRRGFCVISLPTDAGRDCTLRATCVQKTTCSDLSQIKYGRWSSALHGRWGVYWVSRSLNQRGRAMETGMGNALLDSYLAR